MFLDYIEEEEGLFVRSIKGKAFFAYAIEQDSLFVSHLYVRKEFRGGDTTRELKKLIESTARELGIKKLGATLYLKKGREEHLVKMLSLHMFFGFLPIEINNNYIYTQKILEE